jgi:hypothetical protein
MSVGVYAYRHECESPAAVTLTSYELVSSAVDTPTSYECVSSAVVTPTSYELVCEFSRETVGGYAFSPLLNPFPIRPETPRTSTDRWIGGVVRGLRATFILGAAGVLGTADNRVYGARWARKAGDGAT